MSIIHDAEGNKIVLIIDIIFKGKRSVEWADVEKYLRQYVGEFYQIADTKDIIYIGTDLPDEYAGSNYTKNIKGTVAKAKANVAQAIPEMIEIATSKIIVTIWAVSQLNMYQNIVNNILRHPDDKPTIEEIEKELE